jgi:bifunctional UDP-N-acetylglucosamine pyrophosphorylase/glucosamine-1-phosphate N-acetyltransferase
MSTCVILAAGQGKRTLPLTYTRPKVMLPVANKPIIEWNLLRAKKAGIKHFIFIIGYKSEMVRNYFKDGSDWDLDIEYVNQGTPKGTGHAIGVIESFIDDHFLVLSGDTIFGYEDISLFLGKSNSMGLYQVDNPEEYGVVETKDELIVKIHEKISNPVSKVINAGIYHFTKDIFQFIKQTRKSLRGEYELTDAINLAVEKIKISAIQIHQWRDIVYPWDLLHANQEILNCLNSDIQGTLEKYVTVKGKVQIGKETTVMNGSYIHGPVIIGKNCRIGPNCYIRPYSVIGDNCHIGAATEIKNALVMQESNLPHHNYVGDSVIGSKCNLGSGTKIANLRLDKKTIIVNHQGRRIDIKRKKLGVIMGDDVQTGINAMINVGSIIGNNVLIGPGSVVHGSIEPNTYIM